MSQPQRIVVYTDGACSGNPGPGGWAWLVPDGGYGSGAEVRSTNQRMEITAAWRAVAAIEGPLEVRSDSTYVVNCFRDRWWEGWLARNWHNSARKPVANRDLWEPFIGLVRSRGDVTFTWVKGHGSDPWNDKVDRLAVAAMRNQADSAGDALPDQLGPSDSPRRSSPAAGSGAAGGLGATSRAGAAAAVGEAEVPGTAADGGVAAVAEGVARARAALNGGGEAGEDTAGVGADVGAAPDGVGARNPISGHGLVILGHQPPELGGYDPNPLAQRVQDRIEAVLRAKATLVADLVVVSGLRLGAEQLGAEAAVAAGLPLVVVLPYPDPDTRWSAANRRRFGELCRAALEVIVLQRKAPSSTAQAATAMTRRDAWLIRHSAEALLVWDGGDQRLAKLHRSLTDHLGEDVWVVDPTELS
ncbi:MAG: SLOG family protein [Acidimicrobiales bacterium]